MITSLQKLPVALIVLPCVILATARPFGDAEDAAAAMEEVPSPRTPVEAFPTWIRGVESEDPARWFGIVGCVLLLMGGRCRR